MADLSGPLPFPDGTFDDVIASLVLHYLQDWRAALTELRRVLKSGGRLIVSVDHPLAITFMRREAGHEADYFATTRSANRQTSTGSDSGGCGGRAAPREFRAMRMKPSSAAG